MNVEANVSQVETETSSLSSLVNQSQMRELPLNGRNFEQLILLAPGAISYPAGGSSALVGRAATFSISGARPEGHAILLDGENLQDWWQRGSGANVSGTSLGVEAIAEFQTLTNTYGAQYGGNGAVVNAVTKSGTNGFHGSAFDFLRNSAMDARNFFDGKAPPPFRKNQYGGSVGGPCKEGQAVSSLRTTKASASCWAEPRWLPFRTPTPAMVWCLAAWPQRTPATRNGLANVAWRIRHRSDPRTVSGGDHAVLAMDSATRARSRTRSFTKITFCSASTTRFPTRTRCLSATSPT